MPPNGLTLKQRLAALSIAPSAPSSPHGSQQFPFSSSGSPHYPSNTDPQTPKSPRRKGFNFAAPWGKRLTETSNSMNVDPQGRELVQQTMAKLIFQAGVDYETRPMVVINASALPDPREINYDSLLSQILLYLNLYVESDYTVVFLAAGGKHSPGWNWVWKAYRSLSRKYRKNLKRLYVVHPTFFSKMLFSLAGAIISPKFFRKITYLNTLSELACHVPLTQIDIPPAVYEENFKHEKRITLPLPTASVTFGVPLEDIMGYDGEKGGIPRIVKDAIQYLRDTGLEELGLFRRSTSSTMLRSAQEAYDRGNVVSLETFNDPHLVAVLLKKYLRDLPTPIFPEALYPIIKKCPMPTSDPGDMASIQYIREILLPEIPVCAYILLSHVLHLMHDVSLRSASNRMDAHNLAVVLCPNLVSSTNPVRDVLICAVPGGPALFQEPEQTSDSNSSSLNKTTLAENKTPLGAIIKLCIQRYYEVFDEVVDRSEAAALRSDSLRYAYEHGDSTPDRSWSRDISVDPSDDERQHPSSSGTNAGRFSDFTGNAGNPPRPEYHRRHSSGVHTNPDDDEDIDDAMLVMPIGPNHGQQHGMTNGNGTGPLNGRDPSSAYKPRHRSTVSNGPKSGAAVRSINTDYGAPPSSFSPSPAYATYSKNKARSTISVEKASSTIGPGRKGSISIGRGTSRKSTGSGVAAVGITAEGFFSPLPGTQVPPVPPLPNSSNKQD